MWAKSQWGFWVIFYDVCNQNQIAIDLVFDKAIMLCVANGVFVRWLQHICSWLPHQSTGHLMKILCKKWARRNQTELCYPLARQRFFFSPFSVSLKIRMVFYVLEQSYNWYWFFFRCVQIIRTVPYSLKTQLAHKEQRLYYCCCRCCSWVF